MIFNRLITFAWVCMNGNFDQRWEFVEQVVTNLFGNKMTLKCGLLAMYSNMHFTI